MEKSDEKSTTSGYVLTNQYNLTKEEELELGKIIKQGGSEAEAAKEKLINGNLEVIRFVANKIGKKYRIDADDYTVLGYRSLKKAADTYDYTKGVLFKSYAKTVIRNAIIDDLRKKKKPHTSFNENIAYDKGIETTPNSQFSNELDQLAVNLPDDVKNTLTSLEETGDIHQTAKELDIPVEKVQFDILSLIMHQKNHKSTKDNGQTLG